MSERIRLWGGMDQSEREDEDILSGCLSATQPAHPQSGIRCLGGRLAEEVAKKCEKEGVWMTGGHGPIASAD